MVRLFVALALPASLRTHLSMLCGGIPGARWVPPENLHLTLRFVGEVENWRADEVDEALCGIRAKPFDLSLAGVGTFEKSGKVQALWAGADRCEALTHLQSKVETALQRIGLEPERRRFAPHVTLARTDKAPTHKLVEFVQAHSLFRAPPVAMDCFTLFSSRLGKERPVYVPEVEYDLA